MPKILLVDDQKSIREQLKILIATKNNLELIGTAENGAMAIEQVEISKPDIILLDLQMIEMNGIEVAKVVNNRFPESRVIILTSMNEEYYLEQIQETEIAAILPKSSSGEQIIQAIEDATQNSKGLTELKDSDFDVRKNSTKTLFFFCLLIFGVFLINLLGQPKAKDNQENTQADIVHRANEVVALGKLVPNGEIIKLSVANADNSRVNKILVSEGEQVEKNQVIAVLQGFENRQRDLEDAEKEVELAQANLKQTRLGFTKKAELAAQRAHISRLKSQLSNEHAENKARIDFAKSQLRLARLTYDQNKLLQREGAVTQIALNQSKEQLDMAQANLNERQAQFNNNQETLKQQIIQEQENLAKLQEISPLDVQIAEIELEKAIIAVGKSKADLEDTQVKVPISGQILRINTQVGEQVNTEQGIVEIGRTDEMYAIAEVYETDISKVKVGQTALISSEYGGFEGKLKGRVEYLSLQVGAQNILGSSKKPTHDKNSRIVEVKIKINPEDNHKVASLTNMQVRVEINN